MPLRCVADARAQKTPLSADIGPPDCGQPVARFTGVTYPGEVPLSSHPLSVIGALIDRVALRVQSNDVRAFFIGRLVDADLRTGERDCDERHTLYETVSLLHAIQVEAALIDHFLDHPKIENVGDHGCVSGRAGTQLVFLALWR